MSLSDRIINIIKQKVNKIVEKHEDPREALDYSAVKQAEMMQRLRRDVIQVTASKKRLEMQKSRIQDNIKRLDDQTISAVKSGRDDLARLALERKNANLSQLKDLDNQILEIQSEQIKLQEAESRLSAKIESFKSKKEIIKAKYSAAEAQVRVKENLTGISEEMSDIGVAISRAEEKTEALKSKSMAIDEMIDSGMLIDHTNNKDQIEMELERSETKEKVESELARLKSSLT
jgi:phage shock protein A